MDPKLVEIALSRTCLKKSSPIRVLLLKSPQTFLTRARFALELSVALGATAASPFSPVTDALYAGGSFLM
jgi:hypothetical protein